MVVNDKCIKTKIKIYNNKICKKFHDNEIPKNNEYCTCLSVILLDSVVKIDNNCQQILLECKYEIKKKKIINTISEELESSRSDN